LVGLKKTQKPVGKKCKKQVKKPVKEHSSSEKNERDKTKAAKKSGPVLFRPESIKKGGEVGGKKNWKADELGRKGDGNQLPKGECTGGTFPTIKKKKRRVSAERRGRITKEGDKIGRRGQKGKKEGNLQGVKTGKKKKSSAKTIEKNKKERRKEKRGCLKNSCGVLKRRP